MATYRIVTEFNRITGLPEDKIVNVLHFQTSEASHSASIGADLIGHVASAFTTTGPGAAQPIAAYLSPEITRSPVPVGKAYNPMGGSPLATANWAGLTAALVTGGLPAEVALCASFNADLTNVPEEAPDDPDADIAPERPAARRRGRLYIGPLVTTAAELNPCRPSAGVRNACLGLVHNLANPTNPTLTALNAELVVRSDSGFAGASYPVIRATVDDAFDTQRRRGVARTIRQTLAV